MTQKNKAKIVLPMIAALIVAGGPVILNASPSLAQGMPVSQSPVRLVENADRTASTYSREHAGIVVAVFLGTQSNVTPEQIKTILTKEFVEAGVSDPVTFFFDQNDTPGTGMTYYYAGYVDGPFNLADARPQAIQTARTYLFRKENGLLSY